MISGISPHAGSKTHTSQRDCAHAAAPILSDGIPSSRQHHGPEGVGVDTQTRHTSSDPAFVPDNLRIVESDAEQFEPPTPPPTGWPPERIAVAVVVGFSVLLLAWVIFDAAVRFMP